MNFEYFYRNNTGRKYNTPEEKEEASRAWGLGAELAGKRKDVSAEKIRKLAEKAADKAKPANSILWVRAFCRGYAETNAARQEEQKDMTETIKKLWKTNKLMDAVAIARELSLAPSQVMQAICTFTTAEERREREYAIAKDYYDSTGSWPEGYEPGFEEEVDEAQDAPQAEPPSKEEPDAELVEPDGIPEPPKENNPSRYQIIAAHLVQISLQLKAIEEEFENYKKEKEETLQLAYEAIEAAKEEAAKEERKRILTLINQ